MTLFNFSNVYTRQDFYKDTPYKWIDCKELTGVHGFCDRNALKEIEERAGDVKDGIRFIDSGNYHYVSYALTKKQQEPFDLVVLDHHTDMVPSRFSNLLSCGNWIRQSLEDEECLQHVILLGVCDELAGTIEKKYYDRVTVYTETDISREGWLSDFADKLSEPVYLSVDKDVLSPKEVTTDWDQGTMTFHQLHMIWDTITEEIPVLSVDVCGEYSRINGNYDAEGVNKKNSLANEKMLKMVLNSNYMHNNGKTCKTNGKNLTADRNYDIISVKCVV